MLEVKVGEDHKFSLEKKEHQLTIDGHPSKYEVVELSNNSYKVFSDQKIYIIELLEQNGKSLSLSINNHPVDVEVSDHIDQILEKLGMDQTQTHSVSEIKAPMPGMILSILVEEGKSVVEGDHLLVLEAMKMENVIKSPGEGIVKKIHVSEKENVEKNHVLLTFE